VPDIDPVFWAVRLPRAANNRKSRVPCCMCIELWVLLERV
jgi:hypothetical protein